MSVADLSIDDREALADSLSPERLAADRALVTAAEEKAAEWEQANEAEIRELSESAQADATLKLDNLLLAMGNLIDARLAYSQAQDAGKAIQARARKADLPVPLIDNYPTRVLGDYSTRKIDQAWRQTIASRI